MKMLFRPILTAVWCVPLILVQPGSLSAESQAGATSEQKGAPVKSLSSAEKLRFDSGKELYAVICGACHQPHGNGQDGLAPPLANSEWVNGPESRVVRLTLQGLRGPIKVKGKVYQLEMPTMAVLDDDQIAALLTYVRREWGNTGTPVEPKFVAKIRAETEKREEAWTEAELLKIP